MAALWLRPRNVKVVSLSHCQHIHFTTRYVLQIGTEQSVAEAPASFSYADQGVFMSRLKSESSLHFDAPKIKTIFGSTGERTSTIGTHTSVWRIVRGVVTGLAVLLLFAAAGLLLAQNRYDGKVYPAVSAGEINLGGRPLVEANTTLQQYAASSEGQTVRLTFGDKSWEPTLSDLGISVDVDRTLTTAFNVGREETARTRISKLTSLLRNDTVVPLMVTVDQTKLNFWFDNVDADLGLKPHDAFLVINGATVSIEPEVEGTVVDRAAATALVTSGARLLSIQDGPLPVVATIARVRAGDLIDVQAKVQDALAKPVKLKYPGGKRWTLEPEQLGQFILQQNDPAKKGAAAFSVSLDEEALAAWLTDLVAGEINRDPVNAKIAWSNDAQTVFATKESVDGAKLKSISLARDVVESFWGNHSAITVPVTVLKPDIDSNNLEALGINARLSVGDSSYVGSNGGRATNIVVGSQLLNGALIPPHGTFSFNHSIGVIDVEKGYVEASVISGERIGRDVGGGICQVSTTVFRAAMLAGLPIVEWWPHTYRLGFYELDGWPPGYDASILQPNGDPFSGGDFRFENPTDSWMLVESYTEAERVYVIIYGRELGYTVAFSDPQISDPIEPPEDDIEVVDDTLVAGTIEQSELAQPGYQVVIERTVTGKDGEVVIQDTWDTYFSSRPDVWKVSPDMQGQSPGAG